MVCPLIALVAFMVVARFAAASDGESPDATQALSAPAAADVAAQQPDPQQAVAEPAEPAIPPEQLAFFEAKIRPILVTHCYECHSSDAKELMGGLSVEHRESLLTGGDSGPSLVPGKIDEGTLLDALRYESFEMPPSGKLPAAVIADFEQWVKLGAPDPRSGKAVRRETIDLEQGAQYWSYRPVQKPPVPEVKQQDWPRGEIDHFVLARLEDAGLQPVADADRALLIRRVSYALTGLPPTWEETQSFVSDNSPDAYERLVDRLLDSPRFGERWGRHWFDVVRFAETSGGGRNLIFPDAWRYRDFVIDSFNRDKPLDFFIAEQIAGDLMPYDTVEQRVEQLVASGFLALGPTNYEEQDKEQLRMDVVDEQIDTFGRAFLGMTLGCARCHDHKFDPVPTNDYYALAGIFRSTKTLTPGSVSGWVTRPLPGEEAALEAHRAQTAELLKWNLRARELRIEVEHLSKNPEALAKAAEASDNPLQPKPPTPLHQLEGIVVDDVAAVLRGDWIASTHFSSYVGQGYVHDNGKGRGEKSITYTVNLPSAGRYEVRIAYTASGVRASNVPVVIRHGDTEKTVIVDQRRPPPIDGLFRSLGNFEFADTGKPVEIVISNQDVDGIVIADAVQFLSLDAPPVPKSESDLTEEPSPAVEVAVALARLQTELAEAEARIAELKASPLPRPSSIMAVQDEPECVDCQVHIRGNVRNLGYEVPRGFLSVVAVAAGKQPTPPVISPDQSGRLELAHWVASNDNPLTTRVMANRVWHWLMGVGLVRTVDNVGTTGELPSHPELLDWLASQLVEDGWSLKKTVRRIVLSRTFRLASVEDRAALAVDPQNRLLWRMNRHRLEAECLRDTMLCVSGSLDLSPPGPTVISKSGAESIIFEPTFRRSVYVPLVRNVPDDLLDVFDAANPSMSTGARTISVLPTQALYLMNSPFVREQAELSARRLLALEFDDQAQRVTQAYRLALGRDPKPAELRVALEFLAAAPANASAQQAAWAGLFQTLFGCIDFRYVN